MNKVSQLFILAAATLSIGGCCGSKSYEMGTYGYDLAFFAKHGIETLELKSEDGKSKVLLVPAYQGHIMTTTADGDSGDSYGWINYKFIESGERSPQFNPTGGEERFWLGPEGGVYSWYFKKGQEQIHANWVVPSVIDTESFDVESKDDGKVVFTKEFTIKNASDNVFDIAVRRIVQLHKEKEIASILGLDVPEGIKTIAYSSDNVITNKGLSSWTKETGMPSIWLLGMFNPTPSTTVMIPYEKSFEGRKVNDEYFGKIPSDRLIMDDGMIYFKIDGKCRTKLGLPSGSAKDICGSYDSEKGVLTILKYTVPSEKTDYVNSQWGQQDDPFGGDVINSYNDGPTEDGVVMGPFYEIETSSPGAALAPGESLSHKQYTMHFQGDETKIGEIVKAVFGIEIKDIVKRFK